MNRDNEELDQFVVDLAFRRRTFSMEEKRKMAALDPEMVKFAEFFAGHLNPPEDGEVYGPEAEILAGRLQDFIQQKKKKKDSGSGDAGDVPDDLLEAILSPSSINEAKRLLAGSRAKRTPGSSRTKRYMLGSGLLGLAAAAVVLIWLNVRQPAQERHLPEFAESTTTEVMKTTRRLEASRRAHAFQSDEAKPHAKERLGFFLYILEQSSTPLNAAMQDEFMDRLKAAGADPVARREIARLLESPGSTPQEVWKRRILDLVVSGLSSEDYKSVENGYFWGHFYHLQMSAPVAPAPAAVGGVRGIEGAVEVKDGRVLLNNSPADSKIIKAKLEELFL